MENRFSGAELTVLVPIAIACALLRAFVVMVIFNWFLSDWLELRQMNYAVAFGLCLFVAVFTTKGHDKKDRDETIAELAGGLSVSATAWLMAVVAHVILN